MSILSLRKRTCQVVIRRSFIKGILRGQGEFGPGVGAVWNFYVMGVYITFQLANSPREHSHSPYLENPYLSSDVLCHLDAVNRLSLEQMPYLRGREEDAIASSDITKAPIVALCDRMLKLR